MLRLLWRAAAKFFGIDCIRKRDFSPSTVICNTTLPKSDRNSEVSMLVGQPVSMLVGQPVSMLVGQPISMLVSPPALIAVFTLLHSFIARAMPVILTESKVWL